MTPNPRPHRITVDCSVEGAAGMALVWMAYAEMVYGKAEVELVGTRDQIAEVRGAIKEEERRTL